MLIERPYEDGACEECAHRCDGDMCGVYTLGMSAAYCPHIRNCEKYYRNYAVVGLEDYEDEFEPGRVNVNMFGLNP